MEARRRLRHIPETEAAVDDLALFLNFTLVIVPVINHLAHPPEPGLMRLPPRDPRRNIFNRSTGIRWSGLRGVMLGALSLAPVAFGPDRPATDVPPLGSPWVSS